MPIYLKHLDIVSETSGLNSVLIVPCIFCPAVTASVKKEIPFMNVLRSVSKSAPLEHDIQLIQSRLKKAGVATKVFKSSLFHQWLLCMWTSRRREKLQKTLKHYQAVIVLGCDSAIEIVRELVDPTTTRLIEGMEVVGFMHARPKFSFPLNLVFDECKIVSICNRSNKCPYALQENRQLKHSTQHACV